MKKTLCILSLFVATALTGCFDIVNESTINEDGSGVYSSTTNMGSLINLLKMMGEGEQMKELEKINKDSTISLAHLKDSIENITDLEKKLIEKATLRINFNFPEEIMAITISIPYYKQSDMVAVSRIFTEASKETFDKELGKVLPSLGPEEQMGMSSNNSSMPDINGYYDFIYENGKLSKKLNPVKYASVSDDPIFKSMKEMGQLGNPTLLKTIFNLPRPVKKAEGIGLKLSDDKKKVTIEATIDDFLESPEKLEYEIEY